MGALADKLATASYPTKDVELVLDAHLSNLRNVAMSALVTAKTARKNTAEGGDIKGADKAIRAAQKAVDDIETQMRDAVLRIRFTALPHKAYSERVRANPPRKNRSELFNPETLFLDIARRSGQLVENDGELVPMDAGDWDALEAILTDGETGAIVKAVHEINSGAGRSGVGFLSRASVTTVSSSETSE